MTRMFLGRPLEIAVFCRRTRLRDWRHRSSNRLLFYDVNADPETAWESKLPGKEIGFQRLDQIPRQAIRRARDASAIGDQLPNCCAK
jgi:hypothetical protein